MGNIPDDQLLAEFNAILRDMPPRPEILHQTPVNESWFGRAAAAIGLWDYLKEPMWQLLRSRTLSQAAGGHARVAAFSEMVSMLYQARASLQHRLGGPTGVYISQGNVFDYFDQLRQVIAMAKSDIMFVDRYLEGEFVSRYLSFVSAGVSIRLLAREGIPMLKPAVEAFVGQYPAVKVAVRSTQNIHERFLLIDDRLCYQSGDSFKDGAKGQGVTLLPHVDTFPAIRDTYEALWAAATVERP